MAVRSWHSESNSRHRLDTNMDIIIDKKYVHFGPYKGQLWNRVPISYLKEIIDTQPIGDVVYEMAKKQLEKRAVSSAKQMDISRHSLNRMSTRFLDEYISNRKELPKGDSEGIVEYTNRKAWEAIDDGTVLPNPNDDGILIDYENKRWKFVRLADGEPRLITIIPND